MNHLVAAFSEAAPGTELCFPSDVPDLEKQAVREMSRGRDADRLSDRLGLGHRLYLHMRQLRTPALYSIDLD